MTSLPSMDISMVGRSSVKTAIRPTAFVVRMCRNGETSLLKIAKKYILKNKGKGGRGRKTRPSETGRRF